LGVTDHPQDPTTQLKADLRELRRLSGPGLARDDDDLVVPDRREQIVLTLANREFSGIGDRRQPSPASLHALLCLRDLAFDFVEDFVERVRPADLARSVEPSAQSTLISNCEINYAFSQTTEARLLRRRTHDARKDKQPTRHPGERITSGQLG
jgi:hypothetical protein